MKHLILHINLILLVVLSVVGCTTESMRMQMRAELDSINVLNRTDKPFSVQDVKPYVQFFESHGSPNDRLLAHYLLGRAYYLRGEAPMALQCYHNAVDCADTTAQDCDYAQLSRVYGQMAMLFLEQDLFTEQLKYENLSVKYAWAAKDTLAALISYEQMYYAYKGLRQIDSAIQVIEDVSKQFTKINRDADAAIALGIIVRTLTNRGELVKANNYMRQYECKSGYFDKNGNILKGKEIYYYYKGLLYLKTNRLDSAEYYFRKELNEGRDFNNQNGGAYGLALVFEKKSLPDSSSKYYKYAYNMNDSMRLRKVTQTIEKMRSMYDYSRYQEKAYQEEKKASQRIVIIGICLLIILLACFIGYFFYEHENHKRLEIEKKYQHSLKIIQQAREDIEKMKAHQVENATLIAQKEQLIYEQKDILRGLYSEELISKQFTIKGLEPTDEQWQQIIEQVYEIYPVFRQFMENNAYLLNDKEKKTCILIKAGFKPKSISNMLNVGPSYISNIRSEMLYKIFGISGGPKEFDKRIKAISNDKKM